MLTEARHVVSTGTVGPWPPDLASGPPTFGFYWPRLATQVQKPNLVKIIGNKLVFFVKIHSRSSLYIKLHKKDIYKTTYMYT